MEGKTWTTPEELIEMTHWLSGAPGKRWVRDRGKTELTWGVGNAGMVGLVFGVDRECGPIHAWADAAPYTFVRDNSVTKMGTPAYGKVLDEWLVRTDGPDPITGSLPRNIAQAIKGALCFGDSEKFNLASMAGAILEEVREQIAKAEVVKDADGKLRIVTGGA